MVAKEQQAVRYAITSLGDLLPAQGFDDGETRRLRWLAALRRWAADGVDYIQLREKFLDAGEVFALAEEGLAHLRAASCGAKRPRLLVSGRADVALAAGADGVHLTSRLGELRPGQVRKVFQSAGKDSCLVTASCHTPEEVAAARAGGVDMVLFGPVFEKRVGGIEVVPGVGLRALEQACREAGEIPVLALGGVTPDNFAECRAAGCAGFAGIRPFQMEG